MTDRYAVFGNPVGHSKSPRIHALFAKQTGQDISYQAILAEKDGFAAAISSFLAAGEGPARGANVTVPFKEEAFRLATRRTARAEAAGAVNTLSFEAGAMIGDNTDGAGLVRDIKDNLGTPLAGRRVLLLGAGGAARGVILPLLQEQPSSLLVVNRTASKAEQLVTELSRLASEYTPGLQAGDYASLNQQSFDIVINATSAGLDNSVLPIPSATFAPDCLAYDMVYGRETPFMAQARATGQAGLRVADGLGMLVEQAAEAFFLGRGIRPQTAPVMATLRG